MIHRLIKTDILKALAKFPVVGLIGARQVGKTTLAKSLVAKYPAKTVYLDLERPSDLAKLVEAELYLEQLSDSLVIVDEVQRMPKLFPVLRSLVDSKRKKGRFLILGSASPALIRQSSESLAGRVIYYELTPFSLGEIGLSSQKVQKLWRRGGFPRSYLAKSEKDSMQWREAFIQTHLERDIPTLGIRIAPTALHRFWQMLAHSHGQLWNASRIAGSLGISSPTVKHYLDTLEETFMVRQLLPFHPNVKKRLVKSPKIYLRDCGLLHALLGVQTQNDLAGHPILGSSWEGFVLEQILAAIPTTWKSFFYRTSAGAEVDLLLLTTGRRKNIAIEIKYSLEPSLTKSLRLVLEDLQPVQAFVVYPGKETYPIAKNVFALPVHSLDSIVNM